MKKNLVVALFCTFFSMTIFAQPKKIKLENPSFEDYPQPGSAPKGWYDCGFDNETPPDILPTVQFIVLKPAKDGATYLGMVTRDNKTWEAVGQKLKYPLLPISCYEFTVYLATSPVYASHSRLTGKAINYVEPTKLMVYGGTRFCQQGELLIETPQVLSQDWVKYHFVIQPKKQIDHIMLMAYYATEKSTNGNILIDDLSNITPCPCSKLYPKH